MSKRAVNILFAGVGGQGVLLVSEIMARVFLRSGYDVKTSALRGIAQRGGTVVSHVRAGERIYSPLIPSGEVDILVGLELSEAARQAEKMGKKGMVLYTDRRIRSSGSHGTMRLSMTSLENIIKKRCRKAMKVTYERTAGQLKDKKTVNLFILGVLSNYIPIPKRYWIEEIGRLVPSEMKQNNVAAFETGRKIREI